MTTESELELLMELNPPVWVTDKGQYIPLEDMSTAHVANCLSDLEAGKIARPGCNGYNNREWILIFQRELKGRNLSKVRL